MGLFGNNINMVDSNEKQWQKAFANFEDTIFTDESESDLSKLKQELVEAFQNEELIQLSEENWFKCISEDDGVVFIFAESERAGNMKEFYLDNENSNVLFSFFVSIFLGLGAEFNLKDPNENINYRVRYTQSKVLTLEIDGRNNDMIKIIGTKSFLEKIIFYMIYAKYYKH